MVVVIVVVDLGEGMNREVEDGRLLRGLREVALPRELEVVGIFRTSQHVMHPAVFVPLAIGQLNLDLIEINDNK